jgi:tetratricopeptide (TPR) repeat protein
MILQERLRVLYNAALISGYTGRMDQRRDRLEALVQECEHGLSDFPRESAAWNRALLIGLASLIDLELRSGRPEAALDVAERRQRLARDAFEDHPEDPLFLGECVHAALQVFECHQAAHRPADSRATLEAAVGLAEGAVRREPAVFDRSRLLAMALGQQARMHELIGEPEAAIAALDRLVTVLTPWRDDEQMAAAIAGHGGEVARLLESLGRHEAAVAALEAALAVAPETMRPGLLEQRDKAVRVAGSSRP